MPGPEAHASSAWRLATKRIKSISSIKSIRAHSPRRTFSRDLRDHHWRMTTRS